MKSKNAKELKYSICVSSQVGCAMNCSFCFTGKMGLFGNLSTSQIIQQIISARKYLKEINDDIKINNVVFMGMGEPLHNFQNVKEAIAILTESDGLNFSK